ncbi:MAG TPA: MFS transporter [Kofleriaceae bacterium]
MADLELRRILQLVSARALNTFGRAVLTTSVQWELYARTHSKLVLSAVGFAQVIPVIALFVPAGTIVDRVDRRLLATLSALVTGSVGLGLALASALHAPIVLYFALLAIQGCATVIQSPAVSSLVPLIIARDQLTRANRISSTAQELAMIIGPAVGGIALKFVSTAWIYGALAAIGLTAGGLFGALPKPRAVEPAPNTRKDWRVGLRFIFKSPLLLPALTLDMFAVLFAGVTSLLPVVASDILHVDALGYGMLRAAQSAGAVLMAIIGGRLPAWKRPGRVLLIVVALFGAATIGFGLSTSFPLSLALLVVCGALDNISVVIRLTTEQLVVPDWIRGRVSAVHYVFIGMSNELGGAESGLAADLFGTVPAIVGGGAVAVIVVGLVALKWRELARMPPLAELRPAGH